jgi:hypothetical protein
MTTGRLLSALGLAMGGFALDHALGRRLATALE